KLVLVVKRKYSNERESKNPAKERAIGDCVVTGDLCVAAGVCCGNRHVVRLRNGDFAERQLPVIHDGVLRCDVRVRGRARKTAAEESELFELLPSAVWIDASARPRDLHPKPASGRLRFDD